ncbi:MAG: HNH endonuclease, partial [bacterium]
MFSDSQLAAIFKRTKGHCHFCGDPLVLQNYARADSLAGAWEIDHVIQRSKGGTKGTSNCLAACVKCNRLRWHRTGSQVRDLLLYGLIAKDEIKKRSEVGKALEEL